jgi:hypothetical protein
MAVALPDSRLLYLPVIAGNSDCHRSVASSRLPSARTLDLHWRPFWSVLELGIQPHIASTNGIPDYSPCPQLRDGIFDAVAHLRRAS